MKLGVHIHLNLWATLKTPVQNSKYFSSFGRFESLQFILPNTRNFLPFLLHFQLLYLNETWSTHSPNHSTRFAFHNGRKFCIVPEIRTFQTFSYATSAYTSPRASRSPLETAASVVHFTPQVSKVKCNLIFTAPVFSPHFRFWK